MAKKNNHNTISPKINFIKGSDFENTRIGKVINWSLTIGKTLVFFAFAAVIFGFVYRFSLDKKIEKLSDLMQDKIDAVNQYADSEPKMILLQKKLNLIQNLISNDTDISQILDTIETNLHLLSQLEVITYKEKQLILEGRAIDEIIFAKLLKSITQQVDYIEVTVDTLKSGGVLNPEVTFSMTLTLKTDDTNEEEAT